MSRVEEIRQVAVEHHHRVAGRFDAKISRGRLTRAQTMRLARASASVVSNRKAWRRALNPAAWRPRQTQGLCQIWTVAA